MANTLTAANAIYLLSVDNLYTTPQQLQGFAADAVFSTESVTPVETLMGVDGKLSGGWVAQPKMQTITLQADSLSNDIFDNWYNAQEQARETFIAGGMITVPSLSRTFTCLVGFLTGFVPVVNTQRILQPRIYRITWQSIIGAPL